MASKTFTWGTASKYFAFELIITETGTSGNSTNISWVLRLRKTQSYGYYVGWGSCPTNVKINNVTVFNSNTSFEFTAGTGAGTVRNLASGTRNIPHGADGRKSLPVSASLSTGTASVGSPSGSGTMTMTRIPKAPGAPGIGATTEITATSFKQTFSMPSDNGGSAVLDYTYQLSKVSTFATIDETGTTVSSPRSFLGKTRGTDYWFRIRARNAIGDGAWSASKKITTLHTVPDRPNAPTVSEITQTSAKATVVDPSYVGAGVLERRIQLRLGTDVVQTSSELSTTFASLIRVRDYTVRFSVRNAVGWSEWSPDRPFTTLGGPPSAPTGYVPVEIASTSVMITTGSLSDNGGLAPSRVRVKVSATASDAGLLRTETAPQWAPVRLSGLLAGTGYWVAQAAYNAAPGGGWGPYGAWVPVTTRADVPSGPELSVSEVDGTVATLAWTAPTDLHGSTITSYRVLVDTNETLSSNPRTVVSPANATGQVIDGLDDNKTYYALVWAESDKGRGSISNVVSFSTGSASESDSGIWIDVDGVPKFAEVWIDVDGVPKLCEVWIDVDGTPRKAVQ